MQPGDTITPGGNRPEQSVQPIVVPTETPALVVDHTPTPQLPQPAPQVELPQPVEQPTAPTPEPSTFETEPEDIATPLSELTPLSWTASEFVENQKPQGWYATLAVGAVLVSGVLYFLVRDIVTVVVVAVAAILFGITGARKPRSMSYSVNNTGIQIGEKSFPYASFKSFSLIEEGAIDSIQLLPLKRLMPPISLYFPPEQEQVILETLAAYLPHEDRAHDPIDRLMKRLHF